MTLDDESPDDVPIGQDDGSCEFCTRRAVAVGPDRTPRWYVVVTKPMQEARAAKELRAQGFNVFCPMIEAPPRRRELDHLERMEAIARAARAHVRKRGRPRKAKPPRLVPALRRYVLVAIDVKRDAWGCIRSTRGVADEWVLCMMPGVPFPIPDRQVEALQRAVMTQGRKADGVHALIQAGTVVEILSGPFASFRGPVLRHQPDGSVVVEAAIFGRMVAVTLRQADVAQLT